MNFERRRDDDLDVRVTGGVVRGIREGELLAWKGIPYAAPPISALRFVAPAAVVPWLGVRDATAFGAIAPQTLSSRLIRRPTALAATSEDCLTVNVRTPDPKRAKRDLLPVMVFIHGGGYSAGSSQDFSGQGEGFVRSGRVVYISFNYRLGALGYLDFSRYSTADRAFHSNLGLRDQVALLCWVRENVHRFGGDPANVTVFGESAGGNAVTTLMATPAARGLFAQAIAQSPPPNAVYPAALASQWAGEYVDILRDVASPVDLEEPATGTPQTPQNLLTSAVPADLVAAAVTLQSRTPDAHPGTFCLAPVVDGRFVPEHPMRAFRHGRAHRVPLIIGTNDREGSIFRGRVDILPRTPVRIEAVFAKAPARTREGVRRAYPGLPARRPAADFGGDYGFWFPSTRVADFHSRRAATWSYRFDFAPRMLKLVGLDATHGVEMFALFDRTDEPLARVLTSFGGYEEYAAAGERMRESWLRFAESGVPDVSWPRYDEGDRLTFVINHHDRIESDPRRAKRRAWTRFTPSLAG